MEKLKAEGLYPGQLFGLGGSIGTLRKYGPVATAIPRTTPGKSFYVCLPTFEAMEKFFAEVDGLEEGKHRQLVWLATRAQDTPVTSLPGKSKLIE